MSSDQVWIRYHSVVLTRQRWKVSGNASADAIISISCEQIKPTAELTALRDHGLCGSGKLVDDRGDHRSHAASGDFVPIRIFAADRHVYLFGQVHLLRTVIPYSYLQNSVPTASSVQLPELVPGHHNTAN